MKNYFVDDNSPELDYCLERHEWAGFTPRYYPNWTEKQWKSIWHNHAKFLREKDKANIILAEKKKREKEIRKYQITVIAHVIWVIARKKKIESNKNIEALYSVSVRTQAVVNSWNTVKSLKSFEKQSTKLDEFEDTHLIYLLYVLYWKEKRPWISKANKSNIAAMKKIFSEVMMKKWLPISQQELKPLFEKIPPEKINEYFKMFWNMNFG